MLDNLYLNLFIAFGAIAFFVGFLCGWNNDLPWQIVSSVYGIAVALGAIARLVRAKGTGVTLPEVEDKMLDVQPGPAHNTLTEFLQPLSFVVFIALLCINWLKVELPPRWFIYAFIIFLILLIVLNVRYYKERER